MTDLSLDRRVARLVGWPAFKHPDPWHPATKIEHAIAALEAMRAQGWEWSLCTDGSGYEALLFRSGASTDDDLVHHAHSLPLAICKAIVATAEEK